MRSRLVLTVAVAIAAAAVAVPITRVASSPASRPVEHAVLPAGLASYLGVYETGPPRTYQPVAEFARAAGRRPNLVGYYSGWGEGFATSFAETVRRHGAVTILQMDPTDASVPGIAAGDYDGYLRSFADSVRKFGHQVVIGFGHEMNATWYTWGYGHVHARTFAAAWRHIVTLFRGQGAGNVTWLWTLQADEPGTGPIASWWPGAGYVTWVGIDGYYYQPTDTFASVFGTTIRDVRADHLRGAVWFDMTQHAGQYHQDWRLEDSPAAPRDVPQAARGWSLQSGPGPDPVPPGVLLVGGHANRNLVWAADMLEFR